MVEGGVWLTPYVHKSKNGKSSKIDNYEKNRDREEGSLASI